MIGKFVSTGLLKTIIIIIVVVVVVVVVVVAVVVHTRICQPCRPSGGRFCGAAG